MASEGTTNEQQISGLRNAISYVFRRENVIVICLIYSSVIGRVKRENVTPSRRLQAKGETSTLQTGKYTKTAQKIYKSSPFNDKNAFSKLILLAYMCIWTLCSWKKAKGLKKVYEEVISFRTLKHFEVIYQT